MIMKKLLTIFLLLISMWVHAQSETVKAVSVTFGTRASVYDDFKWGTPDVGLNIPIHITSDNTITIYSAVTQKYYTTRTGQDLDDASRIWECIDADGIRCNIYMTNIDNSVYLIIEYRSVGWYYKLENY